MIKELFFEDKTIPAAVEKAAAALNVDKDLLTYEVVTTPVKGIFGIGSVNAKIKVEQQLPDPPKPIVNKEEFVEKIAKKDHPVASKPAPVKTSAPKAREPKPVPKQEPAPEISDEVSAALIEFIGGALANMGLEDAQIRVGSREEDVYEVDVSGKKMGVLIGRRGEALESMQILSSMIVHKKFERKIKVILDSENYRAKRAAALEALAEKTADKAVRFRKSVTLEPMSAYERRIIHAALTGREHITTFSVGTEPKRKVIVSYVRDDNK